jgi:nucleoid-associated protein YgaU
LLAGEAQALQGFGPDEGRLRGVPKRRRRFDRVRREVDNGGRGKRSAERRGGPGKAGLHRDRSAARGAVESDHGALRLLELAVKLVRLQRPALQNCLETVIDRETLNARQMRCAAPKKLRLRRHLPARANPRSSPFGLAWRAATEQNRLCKPASGESRLNRRRQEGEAQMPAVSYTVKRRDNLTRIAKMHGVRRWQDLYNLPENASFRSKRPDPNMIHPGDVVMIPEVNLNYLVPGLVPLIRQPNSLVCWATAYAIMRSWKEQASYGIREGVASVAEKYGVMVEKNQALPTAEFTPFLRAARMSHESMASLPIQEWHNLLKWHGLLWVGTLGVVNRGTYLHSRIVEGMRGNGSADSTWVKIVDPENGRRYEETFSNFINRYEGAFIHSQGSAASLQEYYQIRHF